MTTVLIAVGTLVAGVVLGISYSTVTIRRLRRQVKENLEEANTLKLELSEAKREIFKLQQQIQKLEKK